MPPVYIGNQEAPIREGHLEEPAYAKARAIAAPATCTAVMNTELST